MANDSPAFVLDAIRTCLDQCQLEGPAGSYRRTPHEPAEIDSMACVAATNLRYMLGTLPGEGEERSEWVDTLRSFQDPETGNFDQGPHALFISAACMSALSLFGVAPNVKPIELLELSQPDALKTYLQERSWCEHPEHSSRECAAVYMLLHADPSTTSNWGTSLTQWFHQEVDHHTGLVRKGCIAPVELEGSWTLLPHLCSVFYLLAICQHSRQPLLMPARLVDTALEVMEFHRSLFFKRRGHRHLPWVYTLSRCMRYTTHRHEEARQSLERFVPVYLDYLREQIQGGSYQRLIQAQWDLTTLAELQLAVPGVLTGIPSLPQVLDRTPFL